MNGREKERGRERSAILNLGGREKLRGFEGGKGEVASSRGEVVLSCLMIVQPVEENRRIQISNEVNPTSLDLFSTPS